jgi:hypothetical protein
MPEQIRQKQIGKRSEVSSMPKMSSTTNTPPVARITLALVVIELETI